MYVCKGPTSPVTWTKGGCVSCHGRTKLVVVHNADSRTWYGILSIVHECVHSDHRIYIHTVNAPPEWLQGYLVVRMMYLVRCAAFAKR